MSTLPRGGAAIAYEVVGKASGPWVTLLNGFSRGRRDFRSMAQTLAREGFSVLLLDNRGSGETQTPLGFSYQDMLEDVEALWDHCGISSTALLGISYGGVLALNLAARNPDRVQKLILVSTTPSSRYLLTRGDFFDASDAEMENVLTKYVSPRFIEKNPVLFKALLAELKKSFQSPPNQEKARAQRHALHDYEFAPLLPSVQAFTLVLHGDEDEIISPEAARELASSIPTSTLEYFSGVGHLFLAECPKRFYESVLAFLKK